MILCFSGTGNSRHVARILSGILQDEIVDLTPILKSGENPPLVSDKPYVVVAPIYAWRMPRIVSDFLASAMLTPDAKAYFVFTYGGSAGGAGAHARALAEQKNLTYMGTAGVAMPDNYIVALPMPKPETARRMVAAAEPIVKEIGEVILRGGSFPEKPNTIGRRIESGPINNVFYRFALGTKKFRATDKCVSCGWCVRACPTNNIAMEGKRPKWAGRCTKCMACITGCPEGAIEYGKITVGKPRNYIP